MNKCLCCQDKLLRHLSHQRSYWFCPTCHQEMPSVRSMVLAPSKLEIARNKITKTVLVKNF
ncbi:hypothetical protein [Myxosarcina sp. GI1]|uniref:hypothetical protein n=1 Tax=Myxosarcina sp. GI1 TaxID=1541065 RepID=UPI00055E9028|nr:hypothetical protein [Myxosarcina sp. GI1]